MKEKKKHHMVAGAAQEEEEEVAAIGLRKSAVGCSELPQKSLSLSPELTGREEGGLKQKYS